MAGLEPATEVTLVFATGEINVLGPRGNVIVVIVLALGSSLEADGTAIFRLHQDPCRLFELPARRMASIGVVRANANIEIDSTNCRTTPLTEDHLFAIAMSFLHMNVAAGAAQ